MNDFTSTSGGLVAVAAALPGDLTLAMLDGGGVVLVQSGSWIASDPGVALPARARQDRSQVRRHA